MNLNDGGGPGLGVHRWHELQQTCMETLLHNKEGSLVPTINDRDHGMGLRVQSVDEFTYRSQSGEGVVVNL